MFVVVGYRDLRPIDWNSGKRLPLAPGEGHECDRCGREHAVVYEVLDQDSGRTYSVGSGCAKQQFGFDPTEDKTAKKLVKEARQQAALDLDLHRHGMVDEAVREAVATILLVPIPAPVIEDRGDKPAVVRVGDGVAWVQHRSVEETTTVAVESWFERRARELVPPGWATTAMSYRHDGTPRCLRNTTAMDRAFAEAVVGRLRQLALR